MITRTRPVVAFALSLVALGMLSGCAPQPEPEPTPSAVFASEEEAFKAAEETYRAYNEAQNGLDLQDPATFEPLEKHTAPEYFAEERKALSELHAEGIVRGGRSEIEWFELQEYAPGVNLVAVTCINISGTTFTDDSGVSIVPEDRVPRYAMQVTFEAGQDGWLLAASSSIEDDKCPSS